jgi:LmbE family N-acetylglucosaminyl deacetylase
LGAYSRPYEPGSGPILVVAPHPDDETLGCGGVIALHARRGREVRVVFLTDGEGSHRGHSTLTAGELGSRRRTEALAALGALGIAEPARAADFLGAPDGQLDRLSPETAHTLRLALAGRIRATRPAAVFAPYFFGGSTEHSAAFEFTVGACALAGGAVLLEYPVWAWWNAFRLLPRLRPGSDNLRLALGPDREAKLRALACHRTQTEPIPPWLEPVLPRSLARACCATHEFFFRRQVAPADVIALAR